MSGFSPDWLALREPFDLKARNQKIEDAFCAALPTDRTVHILDLGSGAGSTVAAMSEKLSGSQNWTLVDNDPRLLDVAAERLSETPGVNIQVEIADLSRDLDDLPWGTVDAVTTSAFLDLVTEEFLGTLVETVTASSKPFLASLSYDGRASCDPVDPLDDAIRQAMNTHQRTDKGFGAALGPFAWNAAANLFRQAGYKVTTGASDWIADRDSAAFQMALLAGWIEAASEVGMDPEQLARWQTRRLGEIEDGHLSVIVGHQDLVALPPRA
ncbi:class I SAM-dependent methyltransferase [Roseibium polysiphoniae]|uniref:Class I SAM-dependent methyltransferase n=1 Tax=Roseibium polysiphoniae TaxID=2571221 RepID=A0ABR9CEX2_9HYPH|nr:class I SAM-dependent methyltransferase [Roseibium polysiphoniae]MBD8878430.1 class I SAM-dependent methyltransferase [Roseibium polysiphoniae]